MSQPKGFLYLRLVHGGEPFRLLFPLGLFFGIVGVLLWPAYVLDWVSDYPGVAHPRIMIQCFLTSFVIGFLCTALPRLLDVPKVRLGETLAFAGAMLWIAILHLRHKTFWADQIFFFLILSLAAALAVRFLFRKDTPPPAFVLVGGGILCALLGSVTQILEHASPDLPPEWSADFGRLLLYQGYLLLPIMGIGAFLLPRFFNLPSLQEFPETRGLPSGWLDRAGFAAFCGGTVILSFVLEVNHLTHLGYALRAIGVALYFLVEVPVHRAAFGQGTLALALRVSLFSIPAGYTLMAVWPERAGAFIHVVMITGFGLLTLTVASRVILGHSGQSAKLRSSVPSALYVSVLLFIAMIARVTADWTGIGRMAHLAYAAVFWIAGALVWAVTILPAVRLAEPDNS